MTEIRAMQTAAGALVRAGIEDVREAVSLLATQYRARVDALVRSARDDVAGTAGATAERQQITSAYTRELESQDEEVFKSIDDCRQQVIQAGKEVEKLRKDIEKLESYGQIMGIVRRNLQLNSRNFWTSPTIRGGEFG